MTSAEDVSKQFGSVLDNTMPAKPPEYSKLMFAVAKQIEGRQDGLRDFQNICRDQGHVRAFDFKEKRASDIIRNLERRAILKPGQYGNFVDILEIIGRYDVIKMFPGYQNYGPKETGNNNIEPCIEPQQKTMSKMPERGDETLTAGPTGDTALPAFRPIDKHDEIEAGIVTDVELSKLSDHISPEFDFRLAIYLGIDIPEFERIRFQGRSCNVTTYNLLIHWRKNVPGKDQRQTLLKALNEAGLDDVISACFEESGDSSQSNSGPLSRSSRISDKILCKLACNMGEGWSEFGIMHLGMEKKDIDQFKHDESSLVETIFKMLCEWRRRNHRVATIGKLLDLMENKIPADSYDFILEELQSGE